MVWLLVVIGAATATVLVILVVALLRHLRALASSLQGLQEELEPVLTDIRRLSEEARRQAARVQERGAALRQEPG